MEKRVEFKIGSETLRGKLYIPKGKGPFPGVIFFHGSGSKGIKHYEAASLLPKENMIGFCFNFRGCGESDGNFSEQTHQDELDDAQKAFEFFLKQNIDKNRIGVVGGSFGGYLITMLLNEIKIKSLVLQAPAACNHKPSDIIDVGGLKNEIAYFEKRSNWENSPNFTNIQKFSGPLLIIKSENDENVPSAVLDKYFDSAKKSSRKEMKTIEGADHRISEISWKQQYFDLTLNWFLETL